MENPYKYGALANGLFQGYQLFLQQKSQEDQQKDREFNQGLQLAQNNRAERTLKMEGDNNKFNQDLRTKEFGLNKNADDREAAMAPMKQNLLSAQARGALASATKDEADAAVAPDLAKAKLLGAQADVTAANARAAESKSANRLNNTKADVADLELKTAKDKANRTQAHRELIDTMRDMKAMYSVPGADKAFVSIYRAGQAIEAGKAPETAIDGPALSTATKILYSRQINQALRGQTVGTDRPELVAAGIPPGSVVKAAEPDGMAIGKNGKAIMKVDLAVQLPNGEIRNFQDVLTSGKSLRNDDKVHEFDLEKEYKRVSSVLGVKAKLAENGVVDANEFDELEQAVMAQASVDDPETFKAEDLQKLGFVPKTATIGDAARLRTAGDNAAADAVLQQNNLPTGGTSSTSEFGDDLNDGWGNLKTD